MPEIFKLLFGIFVLILGVPIGDFLARVTKDELKQGKKWFKLIVVLSLIGGLIGLIISNDVLMFTFFFIAIVTSRSLKKQSPSSSE
ncbi:MAG: hypothetical protein KJ949_02195 [Nanoarchaeota archaeon]|nr:hypothetical protein [Nanoarchaeota archaeon]MBU4308454.1 hypothetical protein [Nanoarchaeota archaeon]